MTIIPKFYHGLTIDKKNIDWMSNNADPDQFAPFRAVCRDPHNC